MSSPVGLYYASHNIEALVGELLLELGKHQPAQPVQFLIDYLRIKIPRKSLTSIEENSHLVSSTASKLKFEHDSINAFVKEWIDSPEKLEQASDSQNGFTQSSSSRSQRGSRLIDGDLMNPAFTEPVNDESLHSLISWDFNPLRLEDSILLRNSIRIFDQWNFPAEHPNFTPLLTLIYSNYHSKNPYHNFKHAYSVLAATAGILQAGASDALETSDLEELSLLIAALGHDVGHPGINNDYFVKSRHKLAMKYNDQSVLENLHSSLLFELIEKDSTMVNFFDRSDFSKLRKLVISSILNTDMKVHFDITGKLQEIEDIETPEQRKFLMTVIVHAADLGNPVLPTEQSHQWALRVVKEFHNQYLKEKEEGLTWAPFMSCDPGNIKEIAKLQISFIEYVVSPMWNALSRILPKLDECTQRMNQNLEHWKELRDAKDDLD
jgi:3'5'-cyclic nucleotide phosphodiesterase